MSGRHSTELSYRPTSFDRLRCSRFHRNLEALIHPGPTFAKNDDRFIGGHRRARRIAKAGKSTLEPGRLHGVPHFAIQSQLRCCAVSLQEHRGYSNPICQKSGNCASDPAITFGTS